jgi:curli biogenesis system outer membrane secretion channel CsgG
MKKYLTLLVIWGMLISLQHANAQNSKDKRSDVNTTFEAIKEKCKDIPLDERIRITVARFSATASNAPSVLGENMSTMLTNALSEVNCFNVLEEQKNLSDMTTEIDASNSEYFNSATGVEKGKMKLAQIIVTGEVTEYNSSSTGTKVLGIGGSVKKAKIGFILKIINPQTREILKSKSINTESTTANSFKVSFLAHSSNTDPAVADALEKGIIQATEYLADEMSNIPLPSEDELGSNLTMLTVTDVSFSEKSTLLNLLKSNTEVKMVELSSFADNTAVYSVRHTGSTDQLATEIDSKYGGQFEITGVQSGKIAMKSK